MNLDALRRALEDRRIVLALELTFIYLVSLAIFHHYQFLSPYLPGTDGYYHAKFAYLLRTGGFIRDFKWASMSLWAERFSDKEFLYHVYLIPFTFYRDLMTGMKAATILLAAASVTSFYAILKLNRVRHAWLWWSLLLVSGGYFLYRNNMPRPQVLSIILALWSIHFVLHRKRTALAFLCFVYAHCYTAFHLPLIFAVIASTNRLVFERELDWKTPATAAGAMLLGMVVHPYFPRNFEFFYVQNLFTLWMNLEGGVNLHMGGEVSPMSTRKLIVVNASLLIPYCAAYFTALHGRPKADVETRSMFLISLALLMLMCMFKRFAEYAVPATFLFCAFSFRPQLNKIDIADWSRRHGMAGFLAICLLAVLSVHSYLDVAPQFRGAKEPRLKSSAEFLLDRTEPDEVVFTCDWDDAPTLFFYNHKNRYLVFLDPNFMFYWDRDRWKRWYDLANGRLKGETYDALKGEFKVRYGVCTSNFGDLKDEILRHEGMAIVHEAKGAYVFRVD